MSQDDEVPTVDPDNEKGKLEIGWMVAIALIAIAIAFGAFRMMGPPTTPQRGVVGPDNAPATHLAPQASDKSLVPAH